MEKYRPMLLKDFFSRFPDEDSCVDYFKDIRLSIGMKCPQMRWNYFQMVCWQPQVSMLLLWI
jgi:hypothetical protein